MTKLKLNILQWFDLGSIHNRQESIFKSSCAWLQNLYFLETQRLQRGDLRTPRTGKGGGQAKPRPLLGLLSQLPPKHFIEYWFIYWTWMLFQESVLLLKYFKNHCFKAKTFHDTSVYYYFFFSFNRFNW